MKRRAKRTYFGTLGRFGVLGWKMSARKQYAWQKDSLENEECISEVEIQRELFIRANEGIKNI